MRAVDVYTRQCSTLVTAVDLATMGATLAAGGVNPVTGKRVIAAANVPHILAEMTMEGLTPASGEWAYTVGLPGKSGVGGGILAVAPGKLCIAAFSPPLDPVGNSVRGQYAGCTGCPNPWAQPVRIEVIVAATCTYASRYDVWSVAAPGIGAMLGEGIFALLGQAVLAGNKDCRDHADRRTESDVQQREQNQRTARFREQRRQIGRTLSAEYAPNNNLPMIAAPSNPFKRSTTKSPMWVIGRFDLYSRYHVSQHLLRNLRVGVKRARVYASAASLVASACVG